MTMSALLLLAAVAPGFPDWTGFEDTNAIHVDPKCPRYASPSDLRHKASGVVQVMNDATLAEQLKNAAVLGRCAAPEPTIDGWEHTWANLDQFPNHCFLVLSVVGKKPSGTFKTIVEDVAAASFDFSKVPIYMNVAPVGDKPSKRQYPYAFVYGPTGAEPVWQGTVSAATSAEALEAFKKVYDPKREWTYKTGVTEVRGFPSVPKLIESGKYDAAKAALKAGFKNPDPEMAKEAQIVYDAIEQYRGDLVRKIALEAKVEPETAYADILRLMKEFPSEKKKVQAVSAMLKNDKLAQIMGNALLAASAYEAAKEKGDVKASDMKKIQQELLKYFKQMKQCEQDGLAARRENSFQRLMPRIEGAAESIKSETKKK